MSTIDVDPDLCEEAYEDEAPAEQYVPYRALSKAAVLSLVMALMSVTGLVFPALLGFPVVGLVLGIIALRNLRRYPDELSGRIPAILGVVGCGTLLVSGVALHSYVYATEVPEGFMRITFADLRPNTELADSGQSGLPIQLDRKRVFIKGYIHPGVQSTGQVKKFILVPDMKTCCFGGQPKLTDMIEVTVVNGKGVYWAPRLYRLAGIFRVRGRAHKVAGGLDGGLYELKASYVK